MPQLNEPTKAKRIPVIAVFGAGGPVTEDQKNRARSLGLFIGESGYHLLTGGGGGIMEYSAKGFLLVKNRRGRSIGIIPAKKPPEKYPNPWIEIPIRTHLGGGDPISSESRNHINVLSAEVIVALPGGAGTYAELLLATRIYNRPTIAFIVGNERIGQFTSRDLNREKIPVADTLDSVIQFISTTLEKKAIA